MNYFLTLVSNPEHFKLDNLFEKNAQKYLQEIGFTEISCQILGQNTSLDFSLQTEPTKEQSQKNRTIFLPLPNRLFQSK